MLVGHPASLEGEYFSSYLLSGFSSCRWPSTPEVSGCPGVGTERWLRWALGSRPKLCSRAGSWRMGTRREAVQGVWGPYGRLRREDAKSVLFNSLMCSELLLSWEYLTCTAWEAAEAAWLLQSIGPRCQRREQHLLCATRAGDALFLVTPAVECVSSPGSKEWKLGMCSSLHYTNYIINKVYPKQIKNRLPSQKELFKIKPVHLFRAENHFC